MCTQEFRNPVRGQDGVQGRSVFWVCLEHLLDQVLQLIRKMTGEGRVCTPAHLKNQTLPAGCLELDTGEKREDTTNHTVHEVWRREYRVSQGAELVQDAA